MMPARSGGAGYNRDALIARSHPLSGGGKKVTGNAGVASHFAATRRAAPAWFRSVHFGVCTVGAMTFWCSSFSSLGVMTTRQ